MLHLLLMMLYYFVGTTTGTQSTTRLRLCTATFSNSVQPKTMNQRYRWLLAADIRGTTISTVMTIMMSLPGGQKLYYAKILTISGVGVSTFIMVF